jgi:LPXTG-motif cell wall-anchored protein
MRSRCRALGAVVLALAWLAAPAYAGAQLRRPRQRPTDEHRARLTPEEIAEHDRQTRALQERCDEVGRERCLEERQGEIDAHLRSVTQQNLIVVLGVLGIGAGLFFFARRRRGAPTRSEPTVTAEPALDVAAIDVVLDDEAARGLRAAVDAVLERHGEARPAVADLARAIRATSGWSHVAVRNWPVAAATLAEQRYAAVREELGARAAMHVPREPGPGYRGAPVDRGERQCALVSLIVLTTSVLREPTGAPEDVARATLDQLAALRPDEVVRADVAWLPPGGATDESDLLARAPRLRKTAASS